MLRGADHLPRDAAGIATGGWIAAALPHRTWIDPFVLMEVLPRRRRTVWLGDGRAIYRSWWRRIVIGAVVQVVPVWPGGGRGAVDVHISAVREVVGAGGVFVIFPEVGPAAPLGRSRPLAAGVGYFALRTGAPVVPMVIGGGHELYLRRRFVVQVLPAVTARELLGLGATEPLPEPWSRDERRAARAIARALEARTAEAVEEVYAAAEPRRGTRKRWRWLTDRFD